MIGGGWVVGCVCVGVGGGMCCLGFDGVLFRKFEMIFVSVWLCFGILCVVIGVFFGGCEVMIGLFDMLKSGVGVLFFLVIIMN